MRFIVSFLIINVFLSSAVLAQTGIVSTQRVIQSMPAFAKTDSLLQLEKARYQQGYLQLEKYAKEQRQYADSVVQVASTTSSTVTQKVAAAKAQDSLLKAQSSMDTYVATADQKLKEYASLIQQPYYDKVLAAIKAVAIRRKLALVQEISGVLYVTTGSDVTDEVIKELKVK